MAGYTYDIAIKDFAAGALLKLKKESISTEGAIKKLTRGISQGSKTAVPSINNLSGHARKNATKKGRFFFCRQNQEIQHGNSQNRAPAKKIRKLTPSFRFHKK